MIAEKSFKKTVFISLLSHLAAFSIFSLSFGYKLPNAGYGTISFWGQILPLPQITNPSFTATNTLIGRRLLHDRADTSALDANLGNPPLAVPHYFKPNFSSVIKMEKKTFLKEAAVGFARRERKEPALIFHPVLPYWFSLYFKDRQVAHVELMFNVTNKQESSFIDIKRKISSGNLEVDFLTMRYIKQYLFIQQAKFTPNTWQTIKIDLSAKND